METLRERLQKDPRNKNAKYYHIEDGEEVTEHARGYYLLKDLAYKIFTKDRQLNGRFGAGKLINLALGILSGDLRERYQYPVISVSQLADRLLERGYADNREEAECLVPELVSQRGVIVGGILASGSDWSIEKIDDDTGGDPIYRLGWRVVEG